MECTRDGCSTELTGRQRTFCSDKCRKAVSRTNKTVEDCAGSTNADKSDTITPLKADKANADTKSDKPAQMIGQSDIPSLKDLSVAGMLGQSFGRPVRGKPMPQVPDEPCECQHCNTQRTNKSKNVINHGQWLNSQQLQEQGLTLNRVSLPGDTDYIGIYSGIARS